jgi:RNA polymerase sigma factor (sigma-70 family)
VDGEAASTGAARRRRDAIVLLDVAGPALRRTARRYSLCADDADDALQRAVEILLTKAPAIEPTALLAWMRVVTRREALAVRRSRERLLGSTRAGRRGDGDADPLEHVSSERPGPAEAIERRERAARAASALAVLKPQERRAIALQAEGYSYAEIQALTGWTYTKVNRCLAEGRARLRALGGLAWGGG